MPISHFLVSTRNADVEPEMEALEEDLNYQFNYAHMLIRAGQAAEALQFISEAEKRAEPFRGSISELIMYRAPYLRGLAHMQMLDVELAKSNFESALAILRQGKSAQGIADAEIMVENKLGVAYYQSEQPHVALEHHLACRRAVDSGAIKDQTLRLSIYRNLANDYIALNDGAEAAATYRKALAFVDEVGSLEKQAGLFWGLATSYNAGGDWEEAKLYATQALHIAEAGDDRVSAAIMGINLAEIFIADKKYAEAEGLLKRAEAFLAGTEDVALLSKLFQNHADLARRQDRLEKATEYIGRSLSLIAEARQQSSSKKGQRKSRAKLESQDRQDGTSALETDAEKSSNNIIRTHVQALHTAALVEEARANHKMADDYFKQALELAEGTVFAETIYKVHYSYAEVLAARGAYEGAAVHYRIAAQVRPQGTRTSS
jgi:tetratricopeptide (TPR) repeat protein